MARSGAKRKLANLSVVVKESSFVVEANGNGKRIDRLVQNHHEWMTRGALKKFADEGRFRRNGLPVPAGRKAKTGDVIKITHPEPWEDLSEMDRIRWDTLFEDQFILVVNKPPHVIVHPAGGYRYTTLLNALHRKYLGDRTDLTEDDPVPRLVHRIDKETSGVLVVAFDTQSHGVLGKLFQERDDDIEKEYVALVEGVVPWDHQDIVAPIGPSPGDTIRLRQAVVPNGKYARTEVTVVERFRHYTLVRCRLHTGRQHQIRVHMQHAGHPLVGDHLYGVRDEFRARDVANPELEPHKHEGVYLDESVPALEAADRVRDIDDWRRREYWEIEAGRTVERGAAGQLLMARCALHCARMAFPHPMTQAPMNMEAPLTPDFELALAALRADRDRPA